MLAESIGAEGARAMCTAYMPFSSSPAAPLALIVACGRAHVGGSREGALERMGAEGARVRGGAGTAPAWGKESEHGEAWRVQEGCKIGSALKRVGSSKTLSPAVAQGGSDSSSHSS